jgi:hypothetical protein
MIKAWHFSDTNRRLRYGDNRRILLRKTLTVDVRPHTCHTGLHASIELTDAIKYAPGPILFRVDIGGQIAYGGDKICGTERTALWSLDVRDVIRKHALRMLVGHPSIRRTLAAGKQISNRQYWHVYGGYTFDHDGRTVVTMLNDSSKHWYRPFHSYSAQARTTLSDAIMAEIKRRKLPL